MEIRTLRYFVAVCDAGSVSAAARILLVGQPSLSRQLRQLEREVRLDLFSRDVGVLTPSSAGRHFLPIARDLVQRADAARQAAASLAAGRLTRLSIAAPATTATEVVAPFLAAELRADDPFPSVRTAAPGEVFAGIAAGVDLALATEIPPAQLAQRTVATFPIWAYVPRGHRWSGRESVELAVLREETVLVVPAGHKPRQVLDHALEQADLDLPRRSEANSPEVAQALAAAGRGVAVVSDEPRFDLHRLQVLSHRRPLTLDLHAGWDPAHHAAAVLADIAARIGVFCAARYRTMPRDS